MTFWKFVLKNKSFSFVQTFQLLWSSLKCCFYSGFKNNKPSTKNKHVLFLMELKRQLCNLCYTQLISVNSIHDLSLRLKHTSYSPGWVLLKLIRKVKKTLHLVKGSIANFLFNFFRLIKCYCSYILTLIK